MKNISELDRKGLVEALGVKEEDVFEAKSNLLGFFKVLYRIDKRLKKEEIIKLIKIINGILKNKSFQRSEQKKYESNK